MQAWGQGIGGNPLPAFGWTPLLAPQGALPGLLGRLERYLGRFLGGLGPFLCVWGANMAQDGAKLAPRSPSKSTKWGPKAIPKEGSKNGAKERTPNGNPTTLDLAECAGPRGGL